MIHIPSIFTLKYIKSLLWGFGKRKHYNCIEKYCMFIGYQRSGHSYIGALLDAHPNISMGMEVDALGLLEKGYSKNQIYFCLENNARVFTNVLNNVWTGYSYKVPGSWQGKHQTIKVIGDKKGGKSTLRLGANPELYSKLVSLTNVPVKILHVIRNPFDNISTMMLRYMEKGNSFNEAVFQKKINLYFKKASINSEIKSNPEMEVIDIYHEQFISEPKKSLKGIMEFLDINYSKEYIESCSETTYKKPHKSRYELNWPNDKLEQVENRIKQYPFLKHYTFND